MANPVVEAIGPAVTNAVGAMESAKVLIEGFSGRLQAAVDAALENGATAEELAPVQAELDSLNSGAQALADAVAVNS